MAYTTPTASPRLTAGGRSFRPEGTQVAFPNGVVVGGQEVVIMAGPCSVESREQILLSAKLAAAAGASSCAEARTSRAARPTAPGHGRRGAEAAARRSPTRPAAGRPPR